VQDQTFPTAKRIQKSSRHPEVAGRACPAAPIAKRNIMFSATRRPRPRAGRSMAGFTFIEKFAFRIKFGIKAKHGL
jgi:hypothetical protein